MKTTHCFKHVFTVLLMSFFCLASCSKKEDTKNTCENTNCINGQVNEMTCECMCDQGYEGADCETKKISKFIGTFTVSPNCGSPGEDYTCKVTEDLNVNNGVIFDNFNGLSDAGAPENDVLKGIVDINTGNITIPNQNVFGVTYSGSGSFDGTNITFTYTSLDSGTTRNCTDIYSKN